MTGLKIFKTVIIVMVVGLVACTETRNSDQFPNSIQLNDSHVYKRFIQDLDKNQINYRKGNDYTVFYTLSDTEKVQAIASSIHAEYYPGCGAFSTDKVELTAIEGELNNQGIPFSVVELDQGPTIVCLPKHRDAVEQIVRSRGAMQKVPTQ